MKPLEFEVGRSMLRELVEARLVVHKPTADDTELHYHLTTKGRAWLAALRVLEGWTENGEGFAA
jgi:hypothetical protein